MIPSQEERPTCPVCQAPVRDIEVAHIESQRAQIVMNLERWSHRMVLFCGHRVELIIERDEITLRDLSQPKTEPPSR
jgi:hypothetical protein